MAFCEVVVDSQTKDISYDTKLNRSKICQFGVKMIKVCAKIARNWIIVVKFIFGNATVYDFTQM